MDEFYQRRVYYYETDKMQIVHHSNYIRMFEEARIWFFNKIGLRYSNLEEMGLWIPVIEVNCKYKNSLRYDEKFFVDVKIVEYNGCRMKIGYVIYKEDMKTVAAEGYSSHCFTDPNMKLLRVKKAFPEIHKKFEEFTW